MKKKNSAGTPLWKVEQRRTLHNTTKLQFDHPVDGKILQQALSETLQVFPVMRSSAVWEEDAVWFVRNDEPCRVIHGKVGLVPGCAGLNGHLFCVSYDEDTVRIIVSHLLTDGGGMLSFTRTLVYYYCCIHDGKQYDSAGVQIKGVPYEDMEKDFWALDWSAAPEVAPASYEKAGYVLPENRNAAGGDYVLSALTVPQAAFMKLVKENGTSPSVMAFLLFAKAVYAVRDDTNGEPVVGRITVDARKALGIPHTFLNCSLGAHLSVFRKDLEGECLNEPARALRSILKEQIAPEYLRYEARKLVQTRSFPRDVRPTVSISYMGTLSFGEYEKRIRNITLFEGEFRKMNVCVFGDVFHFWFHMGAGSEIYTGAMRDILSGYGIEADVTGNIVLERELLTAEEQ